VADATRFRTVRLKFGMKLFPWAILATLLAFLLPPARAEIVVKDDSGRELRLSEPARRIVALAPNAVENLFAAGAGGKLVGAVDYSDYPPEAGKAPRVGGYARLDLEAIVALKPDLVVAWESGNDMKQVDKLRALGLNIYISQPQRMADVADELERLGRLAGTERIANAAAQGFRQRLEGLRAANADKPRVRVFFQLGGAPLMTVGGPQVISSVIALCGGVNVFGHLDQLAPTVGREAVLEADPETIIATGMEVARPEALRVWDKWTRLTAVRRGNLFHIHPDIMLRHTPRLLDGAEKLCAQLDVARDRRPAQ